MQCAVCSSVAAQRSILGPFAMVLEGSIGIEHNRRGSGVACIVVYRAGRVAGKSSCLGLKRSTAPIGKRNGNVFQGVAEGKRWSLRCIRTWRAKAVVPALGVLTWSSWNHCLW